MMICKCAMYLKLVSQESQCCVCDNHVCDTLFCSYPNEMLKELWEIITEILKVSGSLKEKCRILSLRTAFIEVCEDIFGS